MSLALVTAGPSAIGRSLVTALAGAGHDVAFTHLGQAEAAAALVAEVQATGRRALALESDAGDEASVTRFHALAADWAGAAPRVMVNNAGIQTWSRLVDLSVADWDRVMATNMRGTFLNTKAAAKAMIAGGKGGRIINIASQAAKSGFPHMAPYTSSKHGMVGLTRSNAIELGQYGITVNAVCPNHVTTGLGAQQNEYFSRLLGFDTVEAYIADMHRKNPMGRPGLSTDTAAACAWLASDEAFYVTGEALNVSGGEEMH